jgi:hypothetical protein
MPSLTLGELAAQHLPAPVQYAVLKPDTKEPLPLCVFLLGAGWTRDGLLDLQPSFDKWWDEGSVPRMIIASPSPRFDYYLEDLYGPIRWDSFLAEEFVPHLRFTCRVDQDTVIAGIGAGGYGALKLAFARPELFSAVAALQAMLDTGLDEEQLHRYPETEGSPPQLFGSARDPWSGNGTIPRTGREPIAGRFAVLVWLSESTLTNSAMALSFYIECFGISGSGTIIVSFGVSIAVARPCLCGYACSSAGSDPFCSRRGLILMQRKLPLFGREMGCAESLPHGRR